MIPAVSLVLATLAVAAQATTYYVSATGSDSNPGTSATRAWQTLDRVNRADLKPGDSVLFRRGDHWRGSLRARSGGPGAPITYAAYGTGPKPALLGSVSRNEPGDWRDEGGGVWATGGRSPEPQAAFAGATDAERTMRWSLYCENGAKATEAGSAAPDAPAALRVDCAVPGNAMSDIQLMTAGVAIQQGKAYRLTVRVRCTQPFVLRTATLMSTGPPWTGYSSGPAQRSYVLGADWTVLTQYFVANTTTADGRLTFYLGGSLPTGATFEVARFDFAEHPIADVPTEGALPVDVGNIILGNEESCGVKRWKRSDLKTPGDFWYDENSCTLYLCSDTNPATKYRRIECALYHHIIDENLVSYATYENLALKYGGAHGIGGGGTHHIIVRDCDISYIGGANQMGGDRTVRFGNGIEFWGAAHDNLVERCRLWEIYDAALTNQNAGAVVQEYNITYRHNIIWNAEYSFEYWNRPTTSETHDIRFTNNTCVNAGHGWGHAQRPDPSGRHLCFYTSDAAQKGIVIANNIFFEAVTNAFYAPSWTPEAVAGLACDHNLWFQKSGTMISVCGKSYPMADFARYQAEQSQEPHSLVGEPGFVDLPHLDFHLKPGAPNLGALE